jgi:hypothetical protein
LNFLTFKTFYKRELIFIFFLSLTLLFPNKISSSKKRSIISGIEVRVYKKERKHIETSALLCALAKNGTSLEDIKINLENTFKKPISKSDHYLIVDIMNTMCPEVDNRIIFENK